MKLKKKKNYLRDYRKGKEIPTTLGPKISFMGKHSLINFGNSEFN